MSYPRPLSAAMLVAALLLPSAATAQVAQNMVFRSELRPYAGDYSDIWGFVDENGVEYALVCNRIGLDVINVDDPDNPYLTGQIPGANSFWRDVKTLGDYAYVVTEGGGGMQIVDLSDPENPVLAGSWSGTSNFSSAHNIFIEEATARAYICGTNLGAFGDMVIADLTVPTVPVELGVHSTAYIHDLHVRNNVGWVAEINNGTLSAFDYTNPAASTRVAGPVSWTNSFTHNTWLNDAGDVVVTTDERSGSYIRLWDVSTPSSPTQVSQWRTPQTSSIPHNAFWKGDRLYVSWYTEGLRVVDAQDPANPFEVASYDSYTGAGSGFEGAWGVYPYLPSGNILISDITRGLIVVSLDSFGVVRGTVRAASDSSPLAGATIDFSPAAPQVVASATGGYGTALASGSWALTASAEGYVDTTITVSVAGGSDQVVDLSLRLQPSGNLSGSVRGADGAGTIALEGASVQVQGTGFADTTDVAGLFDIGLVPEDNYQLQVLRAGYGGKLVGANVDAGGEQVDVILLPSGFYDTADTDLGWTLGVGGDAATTGVWIRAVPVPSGSGSVQPGVDATPGPSDGRCFVTGNAASEFDGIGANDVDGGATTLLSPVVDLSGLDETWVAYSRWYVNSAGSNPGSDDFVVSISGDGGSNWVELERLSSDATPWTRVAFRTADFVAGDQLRLRFVAQDLGGGSIVEAAIDDLEFWGKDPLVTGTPLPDVAQALRLEPAFPNPFNPATTLRFSLPRAGFARLAVHDLRGRVVRTLLAAEAPAGPFELRWDGTDDRGRGVASGVYIARLQALGEQQQRKLVLSK